MCNAINNSSTYEIHSMIKSLIVKNFEAVETCWQLCEVYMENVMAESGKSNVQVETSGQLSVAKYELAEKLMTKFMKL